MKKRILSVLSLIILIVGVYQFIKVPSKPPTLTATVGDKNIKVYQGSYCWGDTCADMKYPENLARNVEPFKIKSGDRIALKFSNKNAGLGSSSYVFKVQVQ